MTVELSKKKYFSNIQEKRVASALGWSVVSGSGSRSGHPGDVKSSCWLGECKTHTEPGHSITFVESVWRKIVDEAASTFKAPVLFVDDGSQDLENTWCLLLQTFSIGDAPCIPFPNPIKRNIAFKHFSLDRNTFYHIQFGGTLCYVCSFSAFQHAVQDHNWDI